MSTIVVSVASVWFMQRSWKTSPAATVTNADAGTSGTCEASGACRTGGTDGTRGSVGARGFTRAARQGSPGSWLLGGDSPAERLVGGVDGPWVVEGVSHGLFLSEESVA